MTLWQFVGVIALAGLAAYYVEHAKRELEYSIGRKLDALTRRLDQLERDVSRLHGQIATERDFRRITQQRSQEQPDQ